MVSRIEWKDVDEAVEVPWLEQLSMAEEAALRVELKRCIRGRTAEAAPPVSVAFTHTGDTLVLAFRVGDAEAIRCYVCKVVAKGIEEVKG